MKHFLFTIYLICASTFVFSQTNIGGIINNYAAVLAFDVCATTITVDDASLFNVGDSILIIQMQGANINRTSTSAYGDIISIGSAGNFEKTVIGAKVGNVLSLGFQLVNSYDVTGSVQIVSIPHYLGDVNVNGILTSADWTGAIGGVLIFSATGTVSLISSIDVRGKGFRGGTNIMLPAGSYTCNFLATIDEYFYPNGTQFASGKGEGIAGFNIGEESGRGKQANGGGGGNDHNSGGAGGGNASSGGNGGINDEPGAFNCQGDFPGIGGLAAPYTTNRLFMGGGGGAGQGNNANYSALDGGGIVIIKANNVLGLAGQILANGLSGALVSNDGGIGGSAGGSVLLEVQAWAAALVVNVSGGLGGNTANINNRCYGPGGGGGAGALIFNQAAFGNTLVANAGIPGVVTTSTNSCLGTNLGATAGGGPGLALANRQIPLSNAPAYPTAVQVTDSICYNENYILPDGTLVNSNGIYTDTIPSSNSCDSIVVTNLYVRPADSIVAQSQSFLLCAGQDALFYATSALPDVTYQWFLNGISMGGQTNDTLIMPNVQNANAGGLYQLQVYSICDTIFSNAILLSLRQEGALANDPAGVAVCAGATATFSITTNLPVQSYQWYVNGGAIASSNNASYTTGALNLAADGNQYFCVVTDSCGNLDSSAVANLTVNANLSITSSSSSSSECATDDVLFFVQATGINVTYQWLQNGIAIAGETNDTLTLVNVSSAQDGDTYACQVSSDCGNLFLNNMILTVNEVSQIVSQTSDIIQCGGFSFDLFIDATSIASYQWQINQGGGFVNLSDGTLGPGPIEISGANAAILLVSNYDLSITGTQFQVIMTTYCGTAPVFTPINVTITRPLVIMDRVGDTTMCLRAISAIYVPYLDGAALWNNGTLGQYFLPDITGDYIVNFTDANFCPQADTIFVEIEDCVPKCFIDAPTGFSPNASGVNDIFSVIYTCEMEYYELSIYNRWGELVFMTNDPLGGWDGTSKGIISEIGTYSWYLVYKKEGAYRKDDLRGNVTLIR